MSVLECRADKEPPSTHMWSLFLLAQVGHLKFLCAFILIYLSQNLLTFSMLMQHYDRRGQYDIALSKIDEAIDHTPTVIDLYSAKVCVDICL